MGRFIRGYAIDNILADLLCRHLRHQCVNIGRRSTGLKENTYTGHPFSASATKALLRSPYICEAKAVENKAEMWYWIFLWALFSSLFVHGAAGVLMFVMLQRHRQGRVLSIIAVSIGFLASVTGAMITSAAVAGIYRVAGKNMAPLEALVWGVGQTVLTLIISFSRILATL
ncbi:rCG63349 [Rattus norvegicus]|uniref:RCG63349 n=1 Tax=Rattus norvegicus TaxID=10116 RepID=A6J763_RAT|nr:Ac1258 [Rattus norvegicus]EDL98213.1 rCG63349 [Rattus norvegicus]